MASVPTIQDLLLQVRRAKGDHGKLLSLRATSELTRPSPDERALIDPETIRRISGGIHRGSFKEPTVEGLILLGLDRPTVLRAVNRSKTASGEPFSLPSWSKRLTGRQRTALRMVAAAMVDAEEGQRVDVQRARPTLSAVNPEEPLAPAAKKRTSKQQRRGTQEQESI